MRKGCVIAGALLMTCWTCTQAQEVPSESSLRRDAQQAANILNQAVSNGTQDDGFRSAQQAITNAVGSRLSSQAQSNNDQTAAAQANQMDQAVTRRMQPSLNGLSPEGRALVAQNEKAAATGTGPGGTPQKGPGADNKSAAADGKQPADNNIVITCQGAAYFDSRTAMGVFTEDVDLLHPSFHLVCDNLEIYMVKDSDKPKTGTAPAGAGTAKPGATGAPGAVGANTPAGQPAAAGADAKKDSSIRIAIATGPRVVIEKAAENGEMQTGICRHCTYVGATGDVFLRDMPQVQKARNVIRATSPTTYMVLKQDGKLLTYGPHETLIIQEPEKKAPKSGVPAPGATTPAPSTTAPKK